MHAFKIDIKSFFEKGVPEIKDDFSINLITGYQGTGKTYVGVYLCEKVFKGKRVIRTNIKSYKSNHHEIQYFDKLSDIMLQEDDNIIYLIDELSKKYTKNTPQDLLFYSFLQQSRKHKRHVFMITQEYIQVPQWLRGVAQTIYITEKVKLLPIFKTLIGTPYLNNDTCEWEVEPYSAIYYKRTKSIASLYDTFEPISKL